MGFLRERDFWFFAGYLGGIFLVPVLGGWGQKAGVPDNGLVAALVLLLVLVAHVFLFPRVFRRLWPPPPPEPFRPFVFALDPERVHLPRSVEIAEDAGTYLAENPDALVERLRTIRDAHDCGNFELTHVHAPQFALDVRISGKFACVFYFTDAEADDHPGFQPVGMTPEDAPEDVAFDDIHVFRDHLVSAEDAYRAAREFFEVPDLPPSIQWDDLADGSADWQSARN